MKDIVAHSKREISSQKLFSIQRKKFLLPTRKNSNFVSEKIFLNLLEKKKIKKIQNVQKIKFYYGKNFFQSLGKKFASKKFIILV